jgi:hypothetical protein
MQRLNGLKQGGSTLIGKEQGSQSFGKQLVYFTNKIKGKSLRLSKHTGNPTFTHNPSHKSPIHEIHQQPLPTYDTIDLKSPLTDNLQVALWPSQYRATPPPKYHGDTNPHKFLMCYKVVIASSDGDDATLVKSLIISLEGATVNWYSRLPPRCIYSWQ